MNYAFLAKTELFFDLTESDIKTMLNYLNATTKKYVKDENIFRYGECIDSIGLVLSGSANIERDDYWGNTTLISQVTAGMIFGETYACLGDVPLMINVVANEACEILFVNISEITQNVSDSCKYNSILTKNLLSISTHKNLQLSRRILHTSYKKIRDRLLSYLLEQHKNSGTNTFTIKLNRQQLADYLNVDRSAMCNELSLMQKDGMISYEKNTFTLYNTQNI